MTEKSRTQPRNGNSISHRLLKSSLSALFLLFVFLLPTYPFGSYEIISDSILKRMNQWIIFVEASNLPKDFKYPRTKLGPLTEVKETYWIRPKTTDRAALLSPDTPTTLYQKLWYYNGTALGCRRSHLLEIPPEQPGVIVIRPNDNLKEYTRSLANAIVRLCLDVGLRESILVSVIVPRDIFDQIMVDLTQFRFLPITVASGETPHIIIHLESNPREFDKYVYYDDGLPP